MLFVRYCTWRIDMGNLEYLWIFLSTLDMWLFQLLFFAWSSSLQGCLWFQYMISLPTHHMTCLGFPSRFPWSIVFPFAGNLPSSSSQWTWKTEYEHRISSNNLSTLRTAYFPKNAKFHKERLPQVPFCLQKYKSYQDYPPWKLTAKSLWNFAGPKTGM